ncbi:helix-turn-helix domain-containing protein [Chachezhania antarctica]|uniref:helix-turn-helix domain-containing protein n=1 Tax=Chachezhania antarctica TaxID=2340860 RepID=UPI003B846019
MLADRWMCSAETVRQLVKRGDLRGFRVGRMIRIPIDAVEEYECLTSVSDASGAVSASTGTMAGSDGAISLRHAPERKLKPKR